MLISMTGYGRKHSVLNDREILIEVKSVNHRYLEFNARIPRTYGYLEEKLKACVQNKAFRGKVEISLSIYINDGKNADINVNESIASGYISALRGISGKFGLEDDLSLSNIAGLPDVFSVHKIIEDEDSVWDIVHPIAVEAIENFVEMRKREGENIKCDLQEKLTEMKKFVRKVELRSPEIQKEYMQKIYTKISEILEDKNIDEQRLLTEAAIFAEKTAVDEEIVRLGSHIGQFQEIIEMNEPVGRKLDFLIQEINREINTIGSKCSDIDSTKIVIEMKSLAEKLREQIQNIE